MNKSDREGKGIKKDAKLNKGGGNFSKYENNQNSNNTVIIMINKSYNNTGSASNSGNPGKNSEP